MGGGGARTEQYGYDELNRLKTVDYGDGQTQSYAFDAMGNRSSKVDSSTGTEGYTYNAANMLLSRAGNNYTNDVAGNTLTGGGRTNTWDSQNRLVQCIHGADTSSFVYGSDGLRRQSTVNGTTTDFVIENSMFVRERRAGANFATYLVGARGPEYRRDDVTGQIRWYLYDGLGSVLGEVDPNGTITTSRKFDVYGAIRGGINPSGTSKHKFVGSLGHPSDDDTGLTGQRLTNTITSSSGARTEQYGYDELNRLKTVDYGDGQTQGYAFDAMGNRSSKTDTGGGINGTEGYTYNAANMLLSRAGNSYTNDSDGNTLTGGARTNTWDSQNRLVQCVHGADTSSFVYGADGNRRQSTVNGTTTDFVVDNSMFVRERNHATGNSLATYLVGLRGPEYRRDDAAGTVRWYLYDGLGSVLGEVDPSGTITSSRKYDVYGLVRGGNNPSGTSKQKFVGQLGHPSENETGLVYMRARYYDPTTGRFVNDDPAHSGRNWFEYADSNPVNFYDFTGRETLPSISVGMDGSVGISGGAGLAAFEATAEISGSEAGIWIANIRSASTALGGGGIKIGEILTAARAWAFQNNIARLTISGLTTRAGDRYAEKVCQMINNMGDRGELIRDGFLTQIYWLLQSQ